MKTVFLSFTFGLIMGCVTPLSEIENSTNTQIKPSTVSNPMIHAEGVRIVDGTKQPIKLRGVLLEGWLMWNGTLWGAGLTSETRIANRLEKMAGITQTEAFRTAIYDHFITEKDIVMIADMGFNMVRVPFNHTILEDGNPLEAYSARGWKYLDNLLDWCERQRIYVVLDLHSVPGGQGAFVSDPDFINVWFSESNKQRTVDIWKVIADRYKDRKIVAGYDLMNEPDPPKGKDLVELQRRIISAIRSVDPLHMIIVEGSNFASDFKMYEAPLDANQVYSFHSYNFFTNDTDQENIEKLVKRAIAHNAPTWNGEFGAHNAEWVEKEIKLYDNPKYNISGWTFWPWKRVSENSDRYRHLAEIRNDEEWKQVAGGIAALFGPDKKITPELAKRAMDNFINAVKAENLVFDQEMKNLLINNLPTK